MPRFTPSHTPMVSPHKNLVAASLLFVLVATSTLRAADKPNLERIVPVPAGEQIPLSDFFRPSLMKPPQLNPSGTHIAALVSGNDDKDRLLVYELKTQKTESFGGADDVDMDVSEVNWLNDQRLIFGITLLKRGEVGKYTANVGSLTHFYPMLQYVAASLIAVPPADRTRPLLWLFARTTFTGNGGEAVNVDSNIRTGTIVNLFSASQQSLDVAAFEAENQKHIATRYPLLKSDQDAGYLADKAGHLAFGYTVNHDGVYQLHRLAGDHWESCPANLDEIDVVGTGDQPGELVVTGPRNTGQPRPLQFMDGATGRLGEILLKDEAYDFNGSLYRDPASRTIVGAVYDRAGPQVTWFNLGPSVTYLPGPYRSGAFSIRAPTAIPTLYLRLCHLASWCVQGTSRTACRVAPRRPMGTRLVGVQPGGTIPCEPWLCRVPAQLPRIHRLYMALSRRRPMGFPENA